MKKGSQWLPFLWTLLLVTDRNRRHSSGHPLHISQSDPFSMEQAIAACSASVMSWMAFARRFNAVGSALYFLVNGEFDCVRRRLGSQVVHAGLQAFLPGIEMHGGQLLCIHVLHENVERL